MAKKSFKEKTLWLQFRDEFLLNQELRCLYCSSELESDAPENPKKFGHHVFKRKSVPRSRVATIDHIVPTSKGGDKWDTNNFAVCCNSCNQKKKDLSFEDWMRSGGETFIVNKMKAAG